MHDGKHLIIHQTKRNLPNLAIVHPVIDHSQHRPLKDQRRVNHINAMLLYALLALTLIPFEFQWKLSLGSPPQGPSMYTDSVHPAIPSVETSVGCAFIAHHTTQNLSTRLTENHNPLT